MGFPAVAIEFDLNGRKLVLDEAVVRDLGAKAAAGAGSSSTLNDLAFILKRAITEGKPVVLQRGEARTTTRHVSSRDRPFSQ